jgi:3-deoxy-7-phosphoheptulonate synthase
VGALSRAAVAAGADGLLIEVHPDPAQALSDGRQSLNPTEFSKLLPELRRVAKAVGRLIRGQERGACCPGQETQHLKIQQGVANDDY